MTQSRGAGLSEHTFRPPQLQQGPRGGRQSRGCTGAGPPHGPGCRRPCGTNSTEALTQGLRPWAGAGGAPGSLALAVPLATPQAMSARNLQPETPAPG